MLIESEVEVAAQVGLNNRVAKDAPVAQLDRASGYEPSRHKLISAAFGVAYTNAHRVSAPQVGPKLDRGPSAVSRVASGVVLFSWPLSSWRVSAKQQCQRLMETRLELS
jgi:hypothetical protein